MIVVTGGSGFLGGALATALALRGERVRVVQRSDVPKLRELGVEVGTPGPAAALARVHASHALVQQRPQEPCVN